MFLDKILVTGASGFVGGYLTQACHQAGYATVKTAKTHQPQDDIQGKELDDKTDWQDMLTDVDCVLHCAGRAHVLKETASDPLAAFRQVNTDGTLNLARQAAKCGVRRFIFISSGNVSGEVSEPGMPLTIASQTSSCQPAVLSKKEAETGLWQLIQQTGMEVVIIRCPLIYGLGVKANFATLMKWVEKGIPLPLGAVNNRRSLVYIGNLADLVLTCITHPRAANQTFHVSDDNDLSTTQLLQALSMAMGKPSRLLPVPTSWLMAMTKLLGKPAIGERLCGNLQLDISNTKSCLGWKPPYSVAEGLKHTVTQESRQK